MKILFYNHTGQVSGAERVLLMTVAGLDRSIDSVVLCPADGPLIQMINGLSIKTAGMKPLAARFTWRPDRLIRYFASFTLVIRMARAVVVREKPDLIHANSIRAGLVMSAATVGLGMPIVWHAHDVLPRHPFSTAIRLFTLASCRNRIIAVSQAVSDRFRGVLLRWFPRRVPVTKIHNAVDLKLFHPDRESRQELRRDLGVKETQILIGSVGQLTPRKGQLDLIEAFARIAKEFPSVMLVIVGESIFNRDHQYAAYLQRTANSLGLADRIKFLGVREDVPALMRAFDLLVVNSRAEPFGLTVVEAMASETPVLATAVGGILEVIRHGHNGWLVPARDHLELAKGLKQLISNAQLRRTLGENGRKDAVARFTIDRFLAEIAAVYQAVCAIDTTPQSYRRNGLQAELTTD